jgi:Ca-activated chloride channel family protein
MTRVLLLLSIVLASVAAPVHAETARTQAPYLGVAGKPAERLPLESTQVDVTIAGVVADVAVKQVYTNRGTEPIEALYVFPGSDRAAIHALSMKIGDRVVRAQIRGKQEAREEYEQAKDEGRTASLLEQLDPSIFRMNVANVLPGDRIEVELGYTELLVPERGVYEFFFPNTLQARYGETQPVVTSSRAEVVDFAFDIRARIRAGVPLQRVESPSHDVSVSRPAPGEADVTLGEAALRKAGAKDYVLRFSLAGDLIQSGLLAYPEGDGGYFLLVAQPPAAPPESMVVPREFIFVVDVSGSMSGEPLDQAKALVRDLFSVLRPSDRFNVVLFAGGSQVMARRGSLPATPGTLEQALRTIDSAAAGGGTELVPALETAYALPASTGMARSIVIVTDGGIAAGGQAFRLIRSQLARANVFAFGVGAYLSRDVIQLLARAGAGEPFLVGEGSEGRDVAKRMRSYIDRPLLTHVQLGSEGIDAYDLEPGQVADLLAERPVVVVGRYRGAPVGSFVLRGYSGDAPYEQSVAFGPGAASPDLGALRRLWARTRIQRLLDESGYEDREATERDVTALGLEYGLLTPYTSFVAIDERVRSDGDSEPVQQPAVARGTGDALGVLRTLARAAPAVARAPAGMLAPKRVDGFRLSLVGDTWTDATYRDGMTLLRVRRDSAAFARLLALRPDAGGALALGERVLLVLGDVAVLVGPDGFGDYPERTLRRVLAVRG